MRTPSSDGTADTLLSVDGYAALLPSLHLTTLC